MFDYLFADLSTADRARPAFVSEHTTQLSYDDLVERIEAVAGALAARGVRVGDVIAVYAPNSAEFAVAFHAILRAGATATTINALYTPDEVAKQLTASRARMIFTVGAAVDRLTPALECAGLDTADLVTLDHTPGLATLTDLVTAGHTAPIVQFDPASHVAVLPYSSGTTGVPKGVKLSHTNLVANIAQMAGAVQLTANDVVLAVLPFFHIYGLTVLLNSTLKARARITPMSRFDLTEFLSTIESARCTYLFIAPPIALALAKHSGVETYDLSSVNAIISGAAPLDEKLALAVAERLKCSVGQGFGMSELSPTGSCIARSDLTAPRRSVGKLLPNMDAMIVDTITGHEVSYPTTAGHSDPGELWLRGPNVMLGYLDNDAATNETIDPQGFLHTGDIATMDAEGYITVVDRLKELIKYKGYQVAPAELEAQLLSHPEIVDAAVVGAHDEDGEEYPKAFVVATPGSTLAAEHVLTYIADRVAPYKKIREIQFIDAVPKSSAGKILRKELRARHVLKATEPATEPTVRPASRDGVERGRHRE